MKRSLRVAAVAALVGAGLVACGKSHSSMAVVVPPPPPPPPASLESKFGTNFATDYDASNNTQPVHPNPGDIIAIDATIQPTPLH